MEWGYFIIGCSALVLVVLSLIIGEIGEFIDDILPIDFGGDEIGMSKFLNSGAIFGFIAGFGFMAAIAMVAFDMGSTPAAGVGAVGGLVLGGGLGAYWVALKHSEGGVGYEIGQLVGEKGVVTEEIRKAGQVECSLNGRRSWHTARSESGRTISVGTRVEVVSAVGSIEIVKPEVRN